MPEAITKFKVFPDKEFENAWRVEALSDAGPLVAVFAGGEKHSAEQRAQEYAAWKNGVIKKPVDIIQPTPGNPNAEAPVQQAPAISMTTPAREIIIQVEPPSGNADCYELSIRPAELHWKYDERRGKLTAWPKSPIEVMQSWKKVKK